jgi:replicative DNA helicase
MDAIEERLPPHSAEAEEAVLGSLLIDPDAIFEVSGFLQPNAFYRSQNRWIYEAILALYERRVPLDYVTLVDELRHREQLDDVGGEPYLVSLLNVVPTSINAEAYGRLVEAASLRRKLINAASTIARLAYNEAEDINVVLDRSETVLFSISEQRTDRDLKPVKEIASNYLDRIEKLRERGDEFIGIPTGFSDLDRLLGGLNKSDLIIIAARPGMGKTALQNAIALTAARRYDKRVAMFNLEMSGEQLVQRMISAETRIDAQRLRRGEMAEHEWELFLESIGRLSESHIYIDDTPSISPMQLRTKCRRLYAEHGLDLVMIDYLQLMQAENASNNRVQEVSEISRQLKGLARELDVPVIAASQLSRAVEQRQNKRPMLSDLRDSGCLTGDTLVTLADTGERMAMRDLSGRSNFAVWALNPTTYQLERATVSKAFSTGIKKTYRLTTRLGRTIRATANHQFLTIGGWKRLDELATGDHLAMPRRMPAAESETMSAEASVSHRALYAEVGTAYAGSTMLKQNLSRERAERVAQAAHSAELQILAESDVYWDAIASIEPDREEEVFDLTVPGPHNFVANDIIVHNSIEPDADVVLFIYRDEYYNPETTDRAGIAEVSVAKHRNGPTGTIDLFWHGQLATFRNLSRQEIDL